MARQTSSVEAIMDIFWVTLKLIIIIHENGPSALIVNSDKYIYLQNATGDQSQVN